jgi:hypothetical protein
MNEHAGTPKFTAPKVEFEGPEAQGLHRPLAVQRTRALFGPHLYLLSLPK